MSEATTSSIPLVAEPSIPKLHLLGEQDAAACVGDFCELPAHREQAVMNRRIDSDQI